MGEKNVGTVMGKFVTSRIRGVKKVSEQRWRHSSLVDKRGEERVAAVSEESVSWRSSVMKKCRDFGGNFFLVGDKA